MSDWSGDNGLNRGLSRAVTDPDLNGSTLSAVELVTYLGVRFLNNANWKVRTSLLFLEKR